METMAFCKKNAVTNAFKRIFKSVALVLLPNGKRSLEIIKHSDGVDDEPSNDDVLQFNG